MSWSLDGPFRRSETRRFLSAAADPRYSRRSISTFDGEQRKQDDYDHLVATAVYKAGPKKAVHSTPPGKDVQKIDLHNLTRSKRKFVVAQALEVARPKLLSCSKLGTPILLRAVVADKAIPTQGSSERLALPVFLSRSKFRAALAPHLCLSCELQLGVCVPLVLMACFPSCSAGLLFVVRDSTDSEGLCRVRMQMPPCSLANSKTVSRGILHELVICSARQMHFWQALIFCNLQGTC